MAPWWMPKRTIEAFVVEKSAWIARQRARLEVRIEPFLSDVAHGGVLFWLGNRYTIVRLHAPRSSIDFIADECHIKAPSDASAMRVVVAFLSQESQKYVHHYVEKHRAKLSIHPTSIGFRRYKRRWGSCDTHNALMFNLFLSFHPLELVEYVVVHELAHLAHKHHQKAFWAEGARILPDFKSRHRRIRQT